MANQSSSGSDHQSYVAAYAQIVAKAWADDNFAKQLKEKPRETLSKNGFDLAHYLDVKVVDGAGAPTVQFPLPPKPQGIDARSIQEFLKTADGCCCSC
jgi:hypothetical protein